MKHGTDFNLVSRRQEHSWFMPDMTTVTRRMCVVNDTQMKNSNSREASGLLFLFIYCVFTSCKEKNPKEVYSSVLDTLTKLHVVFGKQEVKVVRPKSEDKQTWCIHTVNT